MFKKCLIIIVGMMWTNLLLAAISVPYEHTDVQLLKNPYGITSIRLQEEQYQQHMAHPSVSIRTINVDSKNQHILNFSDLFSNEENALQIIATYSQAYFMEKLSQEKLPSENFLSRSEFIKTGTTPKLENYQYWNVVADYLQITFERAQVEPSYYGVQKVDVPLALLVNVLNPKLFPNIFQLAPGDLLFQDLACGELCDGINGTTYGYHHTTASHVGMIVAIDKTQPEVIEAGSAGVKLTPLYEFLVRSVDEFGHPRVMVGRVDDKLKPLLPKAITEALQYLDYPYNPTFSPDAKGLYCSQLITRAFFEANNNVTIFASHPMNFKTENPNVFSPAWVTYFSELKQSIPQGELGNNPGMLSRDTQVHVVYFYGKLRAQETIG